MYFEESKRLISQSPIDKDALKCLDRELAHIYTPGGVGWTDMGLLCHKTGKLTTEVRNLMDRYEACGVVTRYNAVICPCGETYDPKDGACMDCSLPVSAARSTGEIRYQVLAQPQEPAYDPASQPALPKAFISYRHSDCSVLAADIYYSLWAEGHPVFLDDGSIAPGADAGNTFLIAASRADYFVALVSEGYFESQFCKREIAHALRCRRRMIRINVPPVPPAPSDMPWFDNVNWMNEQGSAEGLAGTVERSLLSAIQIPYSASSVSDQRRQACGFLMEQLSVIELDRLRNRLSWMSDVDFTGSKHQKIALVLQETTEQRLDELCRALAP
jgi:hypothetical protein